MMPKVIYSVLFLFTWSAGCPDAVAQVSLITRKPVYGVSVVKDTTQGVIRLYCAATPVDKNLIQRILRYVYKNKVYYPDDFDRLALDPKKVVSLEVVEDPAAIAQYTQNPDVRTILVIGSR